MKDALNGQNGPQPTTDYVEIGDAVEKTTAQRQQLLLNGMQPIPTKGKIGCAQWNTEEFRRRELTDGYKGRTALYQIESWARRYPEHPSTGVRVTGQLCPFDYDINDADMIDVLLRETFLIAPQLRQAPLRYVDAKANVMLFGRHEADNVFMQLHSHRWRRPGQPDEKPHLIEIFGSQRNKRGDVIRHVGVYGPHKYDETDKNKVISTYRWDAQTPELYEVRLEDLPVVTKKQIYAICDMVDRVLGKAGWVKVESEPDKHKGRWSYTLIDDPSMRFDDNWGNKGLLLSEVIENYPIDGSRYTVASNFIPSDTGTNVTKCQIGWSKRLNCITITNYERDIVYAPVGAKPPTQEELADKIRDALRKFQAEADGGRADD
jgi:hypothetical protein